MGSYPEEFDGFLELAAQANYCKFNRLGTLIAVGTMDGRVFIFDFIAQSISRIFNAHVQSISSLCWSRNSRKLLTGSVDGCIAIWDVLLNQQLCIISFNASILSTLINPRNENQILTLPLGFLPIIHNLQTGTSVKLDLKSVGIEESVSAVVFDRRGQYIIVGTSKGHIVIYNVIDLKTVAICKQSARFLNQIKNIAITRRKDFIYTNSQDHIIRCYDFNQLLDSGIFMNAVEPLQKFEDNIGKTSWQFICTSIDGSYVCATASKRQSMYIWEKNTGTIVKELSVDKAWKEKLPKLLQNTAYFGNPITDVQWHPTKPVILTVSSGVVSIWTQVFVENWSAFAPDFIALEENRKYVERESEFDFEDEDADIVEQDVKIEDEDAIDVVGIEHVPEVFSSDESLDLSTDIKNPNNQLWFLPVNSIIDNPEVDLLQLISAAESKKETNLKVKKERNMKVKKERIDEVIENCPSSIDRMIQSIPKKRGRPPKPKTKQ
uniref:Uncharacterized protein n=1 Tax=Acrobeloides nanus TaxID=290746 RepID=A0A914EEU9_9BILA